MKMRPVKQAKTKSEITVYQHANSKWSKPLLKNRTIQGKPKTKTDPPIYSIYSLLRNVNRVD